MYYSKVHCNQYDFDSKTVSTILYNVSINATGFIYYDTYYTIHLNNAQLNMLLSSQIIRSREYSDIPITYSIDWIMVQKFLNQLDPVSTSNMIKFMDTFSKKILSILDAILSLPMNCDIKLIILSFMFINSRKLTTFSTIINHESEIMCAYFGDMICEYRSKHTTKGLAVRKILNHVATLDLEVATRIMCICKQFTTLMFNNQHSTKMFMILMIDNNTNIVSLYPLCIGEMVLKRAISIFCVLIDYWID